MFTFLYKKCRSKYRFLYSDPKANEICFEKTEEKADRQTNGDTEWMDEPFEDVKQLENKISV